MVCSINLNDKFVLEGDKISDIHPYHMLSTEMHTQSTPFQLLP